MLRQIAHSIVLQTLLHRGAGINRIIDQFLSTNYHVVDYLYILDELLLEANEESGEDPRDVLCFVIIVEVDFCFWVGHVPFKVDSQNLDG